MSARELITEHLDLWTGGVTKKSSSGRGSNGKVELTGVKKLRELILELAVRGKLVEQNPTDEPARKLLERIRAEKLHLVKQGEIKKRRKLPELSEMTKPFHLPASWEWAQLEDVGRDWGQKAPSNEFSYIDVASVDNLRGTTTQPSILSADEAPSRARKIVREGTLIYSTIRPYLQNIAVIESDIEPEPIASTAFAVLHPLVDMPARFFLHYLRSPAFVRYVESVQTGIAYPAINDKQFFSGLVPVPPLEEQHRIVQKVDELMALCDRLEQQTSDQLEAHETLVDTLLGTLTQSENATELADNWARIKAHFDTLFTTEQSIEKLKQTILQLAVTGKLNPHDPNDKPASESLKESFEKSNEIKVVSKKSLLPVIPEEKPYKLPLTWTWARLPEITFFQEGPGILAKDFRQEGVPLIRIAGMHQGSLSLKGCNYLDNNMVEKKWNHFRLELGDIILSSSASLGKVAKVGQDTVGAVVYTGLIRFQPSECLFDDFLVYFLNSNEFLRQINDSKTGAAIKHFGPTHLKKMVVPLPPLSEQHRIVQKVDELMALCDQLKERLNEASETRCQMAEAVVEGALN